MPKRRASSQRRNANDTNELIRHHLEEAATHLGMVKQHLEDPQQKKNVTKVGRYLKALYTHHGGHPDA